MARLLVLFLVFTFACSGESEDRNPREDNVLIKYVRDPMDKASDAKDLVEKRSKDLDDNYDYLGE